MGYQTQRFNKTSGAKLFTRQGGHGKDGNDMDEKDNMDVMNDKDNFL